MFTGLVEGCGTVAEIVQAGPGVRIALTVPYGLRAGCALGDSVAINGCCLTVVAIDVDSWTFQAGPETLAKTNLGGLVAGEPVNLERPLPVNGRLGGHFVQGHVDGVATVD